MAATARLRYAGGMGVRLGGGCVMGVEPDRGDEAMGRVAVEILVSNNRDLVLAQAGHLPPEQVRRFQLQAFVDTAAALLVLPTDVADRLGLPKAGEATGPLRRPPVGDATPGRGSTAGADGTARNVSCPSWSRIATPPSSVRSCWRTWISWWTARTTNSTRETPITSIAEIESREAGSPDGRREAAPPGRRRHEHGASGSRPASSWASRPSSPRSARSSSAPEQSPARTQGPFRRGSDHRRGDERRSPGGRWAPRRVSSHLR